MTDQTARQIPEWLSLQDIARAWSEETGERAEVLEKSFREWFKAFLVRNAYGKAGAGDAGIPAEMLEGRQIWRETFETFCEESRHVKPRFWFPDAPTGQTAAGPAQVSKRSPVHLAAADGAVSEDETATQAPGEENPKVKRKPKAKRKPKPKPKPPPGREARVGGGASFIRIAVALVGVAILGLVALWALESDGPVAERDRGRQPGAEQLAAMAPSVATARSPAETTRAQTAALVQAATTQARSRASASSETVETQTAAADGAPSSALLQPADDVDEGLALLIQRELRSAGFDPGPLDGRSSPKFSVAIETYQRAQGLPADGRVSVGLLSRLARGNLRQDRTAPFLPSPGASRDTGASTSALGRQTALRTPATGTRRAPRSRGLVRSIQERLSKRGYYSGPLDGNLGAKTRDAIETYQRAHRYEANGRPSRALYEELEDYRLEVLGLRLFRQGDYDKAIVTYGRIIKRKPKDANAMFNRGLAYKNAGLTDRALADYDAAIRLDPSHHKAYLDRGNIRYQMGFYADAIHDYFSALELWLGWD